MALYPNSKKANDFKEVEGHYDEDKDWHYDPKGYFLIRVNEDKNRVEVGHCRKNNIVEILITGNKSQDIYWEVIQLGLVSRFDHIAYLAKELQKAFTSLKEGKEYVQDED